MCHVVRPEWFLPPRTQHSAWLFREGTEQRLASPPCFLPLLLSGMLEVDLGAPLDGPSWVWCLSAGGPGTGILAPTSLYLMQTWLPILNFAVDGFVWPRPLPTQREGGAGKDYKSADLGCAKRLEGPEVGHNTLHVQGALLGPKVLSDVGFPILTGSP